MQQTDDKTAEQCPDCQSKKKRSKYYWLFFWLGVVRVFNGLFDIIDKFWPKIAEFFSGLF